MSNRTKVTTQKPFVNKSNSLLRPQRADLSQSISSPIDHILSLQRTIGNQMVGKLIQAKLKVGQPGDVYEREADRVAEQIMRMPERQVQRHPEEEREELFQGKETPGQTTEVAPDLESRINAIGRGGQPLPESTRRFFEPRFGANFNEVRMHTNSKAAKTARGLNARALTVGRDIVFRDGEYAPASTVGKRLLAHELVHIVQQRYIGQTLAPTIQRKAEAAEPWWLQKKPTPINTVDDFTRFIKDPYVISSFPFVRFLNYGGQYPGPKNAKHNTIYFDKDLKHEGGKDLEYRGITHAREGEGKVFVRIAKQRSYQAAAATVYHELLHSRHHRSILDIGRSQRLILGLKGGLSVEEKKRFETEKAASLTKTFGADVQNKANSELLAHARTFVEFFDHHPTEATAQLKPLTYKYYDFASKEAQKMAIAEIVDVIKKRITYPKVKKLMADLHKADMRARSPTRFYEDLCKETAIAPICPRRQKMIPTRLRLGR